MKHPEFSPTAADDFVLGDLRDPVLCREVIDQPFDEVYQLAADMGGAGFIFTGDNDADILDNSAMINLNMVDACRRQGVGRIFYSSSACIYPQRGQLDPDRPDCSEGSAYPADPDSEYGWEKLFRERLYLTFARNYGMEVRVGRSQRTIAGGSLFGRRTQELQGTSGRPSIPGDGVRGLTDFPLRRRHLIS